MDDAVDRAINEMPQDYLIRPFLLSDRAEVKMMCITEYNEEKTMKQFREEGIAEGRAEGREEEKYQNILGMLREHIPVPVISRISMMPEDMIRNIAQTQGIALA